MKTFLIMKNLLNILIVSIFAVLISACKTPEPLKSSTAPQVVVGHLSYTGNTFAPIAIPSPYKYALYDNSGYFLAYVNLENIVMGSVETYLDTDVLIRGVIFDTKDGLLIRADYIKKVK